MAETWSKGEIDAIVKDYLVMLKLEQTGIAFVKTHHWRKLMEMTGRTRGAIEYKHSKISAAMEALGLPRINGYRPRGQNQKELFQAVEAHLNENPDFYNLLVGEAETLQNRPVVPISEEAIVFDKEPPQRVSPKEDIPKENESFVSRFKHPAERDARNKNLGEAGEKLVYGYEKHRLQALGRRDLSNRVCWVARDEGDGCGFDILSFDGTGDGANQERWLEVKTTNGPRTTPFYITNNELRVSEERPDIFRIIRLYNFRQQVRAYSLTPPLTRHISLTPTVFRASF